MTRFVYILLLLLCGSIATPAQQLETNEVPIPLDHWNIEWDLAETTNVGCTLICICSDYGQGNDMMLVSNVPYPFASCELPLNLVSPGTNYIYAQTFEMASDGNVYQSGISVATCTAPGIYLWARTSIDLTNWVLQPLGVFAFSDAQRFWQGLAIARTDWSPPNFTNDIVVTTNSSAFSQARLPAPPMP